MSLILRTAARSHVGVVRSGNEDSGYAAPFLIAVADGMGGHASGELASSTAIATLAEISLLAVSPDDIVRVATEVVDLTSDRINDATLDDQGRAGMGTTLTAAVLLERAMAIFHVGDSRAYLWRNDRLTQISKDHTYVQTLLDAGQITQQEADTHPRRNLLMRTIDGTPGVLVDVSLREARAGDRILVCSDGLSDYVARESIRQSLKIADLAACVTDLVEKALDAGAPDNVTAVVADVVEVSGSDPLHEVAPVVVGAAAEPRNRVELPAVMFPADVQPDNEGLLAQAKRTLTGTDFGALRQVYREQKLGSTRSRLSTAIFSILLIAVLILGLTLSVWARGQWYVTTNDTGIVTINNGINAEVFGIQFSKTVEVTQISGSSLPAFDQAQLRRTINVEDETAAREVVVRLACRAVPPVSPCPGVSTP